MYFAVFFTPLLFWPGFSFAHSSLGLFNNKSEKLIEPQQSCIASSFLIQSAQDIKEISHCETIRGNIEVVGYKDAILRFERLTKLEGSLIVMNSQSLMRLDAVKLKSITETFKLEKLVSLGMVEAPCLEEVRDLHWQILPLLSRAPSDTMKNVRSMVISDTSLTSLKGFSAQSMQNIDVNNNRYLEEIEFDVREIQDNLHIAGNSPSVVANFSDLKSVRNMTISNIRECNFNSMERIGGSVSIVENDLSEVKFPKLYDIRGSFRLAENYVLTSAVFDSVRDIGGGVSISNNTMLNSISFFSDLGSIGGALALEGNIEETEWERLKIVKGSISLYTTDSQFDCKKWVSGPIKTTLRGGEIECNKANSESVTAPASKDSSDQSQKFVHSSKSSKHKMGEWIIVAFLLLVSLSI